MEQDSGGQLLQIKVIKCAYIQRLCLWLVYNCIEIILSLDDVNNSMRDFIGPIHVEAYWDAISILYLRHLSKRFHPSKHESLEDKGTEKRLLSLEFKQWRGIETSMLGDDPEGFFPDMSSTSSSSAVLRAKSRPPKTTPSGQKRKCTEVRLKAQRE